MKEVVEEQGKMWKRDLTTQLPVGSTALSLGAILGIAVGGALLLFAVLVTIGVIHVKKKHRREQQQLSEADEDGNMSMDFKTAIRSTRPLELHPNLNRRLSFNPFMPAAEDDNPVEWTKQDGLQNPPIAMSKSPQRAFFRTSSVRDSWPLNTNRPLGFLPGQQTMVLSPVAPPGYVIQDPKWPKRSNSILGRKNSQDTSKSDCLTRDPCPMDVMPYRKVHRRSTSENQLSTILRSTSQRLKAAQRHSMTRTLSTLGQFPGLPPSERLPTPPRMDTESREELVDQENMESVGSPIYDVFSRTPCPKKKHQRTYSQRSLVKLKSPAPSVESNDSLCASDTTDLVILAPLTSPSKSPSRSAQRQSNRCSGGAKDISALIHQDSQVSLYATGPQETANNNKILSPPQRISLSGDPFFSSLRSSKPIMPSTQVQGPRPMYFRKATFGQEPTPERPAGFCSPLRDVSGNSQASPKRDLPEPRATSEPNHFQWFPQEAKETCATQTSPTRSSSRRKGHKRSNVTRMSNLSRPSSAADIVPEEPEDVAPLKLNVPRCSSFLSVEVSQDGSPTKSPRSSLRPPSIATFNPTLIVPALSSRSEYNSPTLGSENNGGFSPTLSICNHYVEKESGSEDEFFKASTSNSLQPSPSVIKSPRHGRNYSADLTLCPTHESQQYIQERLLSLPPLPLEISGPRTPPPILTPRPASRPLPNITSTMDVLRSSAATPAPPILTIPGHLTGPRSEPGKQTPAALSSPCCDSMLSHISLLRRMNSNVSNCPSPTDADSPSLPLDFLSPSNQDTEFTTTIEQRGRSRGSQHYLSFGQSSPRHRPREKSRLSRYARPEIRDTHRIHKERRRRRREDLENGNMIDELTPVKERSSPVGASTAPTVNANTTFRFPTLNREGSVLATPPSPKSKARTPALTPESQRSPSPSPNRCPTNSPTFGTIDPPDQDKRFLSLLNTGGLTFEQNPPRWSDAMTKPTVHVTRRESGMQHPSPEAGCVTPPKWTLSGLGLAGVRLLESEGRVVGCGEEGGGDEERGGGVGDGRGDEGRPQSLGLYDEEGFLKCSPERERVLAGPVAEERRERVERRERERGRE